MSDILMYAALEEKDRLDTLQRTLDRNIPVLSNWQAEQPPLQSYSPSTGVVSPVGSTLCSIQCLYNDWAPIRSYTTPRPNGFKVCDTSGNYRCGGLCCWTVPAGVTRVLFQLWGAGAGTASMCCCGGSTFGPNGGYTMFEMRVAAGEGFCLYAGCAFCCCATLTTPGQQGEDSFICLTNSFGTLSVPGSTTPRTVAVASGSPVGCVCRWHCTLQASGFSYCASCLFQYPSNSTCQGVQVCSHGLAFCWDASADNSEVLWHFDYFCKGCVCCYAEICSVRCPCWARIPAMWPYFCMGTGSLNCAKTTSAPVFGFESCTCTQDWGNGNSCGGRLAVNGYQQIPAVGGSASQVFGGTGAQGGDHGGMGMICVSWCCC